jgi:uncharacterized lipoprotein YajG
MKTLSILFLLAVAFVAGCDNRNTGTRDVAPETPADSQVTHPSVATPASSPSPSPTPQF